MFIIVGALFLFVAICVVFFILLQEGKGGGVAAMGAPGVENVIGARNPLRRLTVGAAVIFLVLLVLIGRHYNRAAHIQVPEALAIPAATQPVPAEAGKVAGEAASTAAKPAAVPSANEAQPAEKAEKDAK